MIYNLLRCPAKLWDMLKEVYNNTKPELAGSICFYFLFIFPFNKIARWTQIMPQLLSLTALNMENLEGDYYVPGNELDVGDGMWKEIQAQGYPQKKYPQLSIVLIRCPCLHFVVSSLPQTVTNDAVLLWASRAISDFDKKAGKGSTTKQKAQMLKECLLPVLFKSWPQILSRPLCNPVSETGHTRSSWHDWIAADLMPDIPHLAKVGGPSWSRQGTGWPSQNVGDGEPRLPGAAFWAKNRVPREASKKTPNLQWNLFFDAQPKGFGGKSTFLGAIPIGYRNFPDLPK